MGANLGSEYQHASRICLALGISIQENLGVGFGFNRDSLRWRALLSQRGDEQVVGPGAAQGADVIFIGLEINARSLTSSMARWFATPPVIRSNNCCLLNGCGFSAPAACKGAVAGSIPKPRIRAILTTWLQLPLAGNEDIRRLFCNIP